MFCKTITELSRVQIKCGNTNHQECHFSQMSLRFEEKKTFGRIKQLFQVSYDGGSTWANISQAEYNKLSEKH